MEDKVIEIIKNWAPVVSAFITGTIIPFVIEVIMAKIRNKKIIKASVPEQIIEVKKDVKEIKKEILEMRGKIK